MGKSLDFVNRRIRFGKDCKMDINDYKNMKEYSLNKFLEEDDTYKNLFKNNSLRCSVEGKTHNGVKGVRDVSITYDENCDFEYIKMEYCICDGTLSFMRDLFDKTFKEIVFGQTYNRDTAPADFEKNYWDYNIEYTVGDFVFDEDYGDFGTKEKPWFNSRFTVMLPIKCKIVKKDIAATL